MARYVIAVILVVALCGGLLWLGAGEQASNPEVPPASPSVVAATPPEETTAGIEVASTRPGRSSRACSETDDDLPLPERIARHDAMLDQVWTNLRTSTDPDHLLAAAILNWREKPRESLQLLQSAALVEPRNPRVAAQLLDICNSAPQCNLDRVQLEQNLIAADKANGLAWVGVARSRLKRSKNKLALDALQEANAAASIEGHTVDYILMFDRAFAASTEMTPYERGISSIGFGMSLPLGLSEISRVCAEKGEISEVWRVECLRLGERLERDGQSVIQQVAGLFIQEKQHELGGEDRAYVEVVERKAEFREVYESLMSREAGLDKLQDMTVLRQYLEILSVAGELEAQRFLIAETESRRAERRLDGPPECDPP